MTTIAEVIAAIEVFAPPFYQEDYDNSGLLTGNRKAPVTGVLLTLDCTEQIVEEAMAKGCNLIIAHHPIIFKGLKRITGANYIERTIILAIKNDIAIYACHTNLDNIKMGVNAKIGEKLGLKGLQVLQPKGNLLYKLHVYAPKAEENTVKEALFAAGAGSIGAYQECSFTVGGMGSFRPTEQANPKIGTAGGAREQVEEVKIEFLVPAPLRNSVLSALKQLTYYEEKPYELVPLENLHQEIGSGAIGNLPDPMELKSFLDLLKKQMKVDVVRHTADLGKKVQKIAVCGGSGSFLLNAAKRAGADVFITADFKYHEFFDADSELVIADIGHYESEQFTVELFHEVLTKKFTTFAHYFSERNTNPIHYFK